VRFYSISCSRIGRTQRDEGWSDSEVSPSAACLCVGVSNYQPEHFEEIRAAGLTLPAVTQNSFSPKKSKSTAAVRAYCKAHGIHFQAYSPLGAPYHGGGLLADPTVKKIAQAHSVSTAQVSLSRALSLSDSLTL
jgi:diketogulonate reductase-like aldo/keto reductase